MSESVETEELSIKEMNAVGGAFDRLAEEPDVYGDADLIEHYRA
jgi:hypothetical protein